MSAIIEQGVVSKFWNERGYGFILTAAGTEIFVHAQDVLGDFLPLANDQVEFERGTGRDGRPVAKRMKIITAKSR